MTGHLQEALRMAQAMERAVADGIAGPGTGILREDGEIETSAQIQSQIDQLKERNKMMRKRKAEEELEKPDTKYTKITSVSVSTSVDVPSSSAQPTSSYSAPTSRAVLAYPNGALRITRTPGRASMKNCINLEDLIHKDDLVSACIFSFFIGGDELYDHLPLSRSSDDIPIYIGRDVNQDPMVSEACQQAGVEFKEKIAKKTMDLILPRLKQLYTTRYGKNYKAFYPWCSGSAHTKILLLVYPDFLRLVITSCNMMDIDTKLGDNHWYIHDLPKLSSDEYDRSSNGFEDDLMAHMVALGTPDDFLNSIRGNYDYSKVKVHLVTAVPGTFAGKNAEKHGLLRLRRIVQDLDLSLAEKSNSEVQLEICTASLGKLNTIWLNGFKDCAVGKEKVTIATDKAPVLTLRIFYPTADHIKTCHASAQQGASNIGCHMRPWEDTTINIKALLHIYESKDQGRLFHQKLIMAYDSQNLTNPPYYVYIGSGNLSQSAWGALEIDKKGNEATNDLKLVKISNFECGVVIPGHLIEGLMEEGTENWQAGIVPYNQNARKYNLIKEKPWNDPRWVKGYEDRGNQWDGPSQW